MSQHFPEVVSEHIDFPMHQYVPEVVRIQTDLDSLMHMIVDG